MGSLIGDIMGGNKPSTINAAGTSEDQAFSKPGSTVAREYAKFDRNPAEVRAQMLTNWLTAGGAPKPLDPNAVFNRVQAMAPVEAKAAAGQGIGGLFGMGSTIGDIMPLQPLPALNLSPLKPGVPYSVPALPKGSK